MNPRAQLVTCWKEQSRPTENGREKAIGCVGLFHLVHLSADQQERFCLISWHYSFPTLFLLEMKTQGSKTLPSVSRTPHHLLRRPCTAAPSDTLSPQSSHGSIPGNQLFRRKLKEEGQRPRLCSVSPSERKPRSPNSSTLHRKQLGKLHLPQTSVASYIYIYVYIILVLALLCPKGQG